MSLGVVTVELPQDVFLMHEGSFRLEAFSAISLSRFQPSAIRTDGPTQELWTFDVKIAALDIARMIEVEGFLARLIGRNWAFTAYDTLRTNNARGVGGGFTINNDEILFTDGAMIDQSFASDFSILEGSDRALVDTAAARGATSLKIKGLDTSLEGQRIVRLGDHVGIGLPGEMNLYQVMSDAICDASGETRIEFRPGLWKRALVNDLVQFRNPPARFVLRDRQSAFVNRNNNNFGHLSLTAIEFPYQEANQ